MPNEETSKKWLQYKLVFTPLRYSIPPLDPSGDKIGKIPYTQIYFNTITSKLSCHQNVERISPSATILTQDDRSYFVDCFLLTENYFSIYYSLKIDSSYDLFFKIKKVTNTLPNFVPVDVQLTEKKVVARMYSEES